MRFFALLGLLIGGCDAACPETVVQGCVDCSPGEVRRGVSVDEYHFEVASSPSGLTVRENCSSGLNVLAADLTTARELAIDFDYPERSIATLTIGDDGSIAVVSFELEYLGDSDERSLTKLTLFDASGRRRWTKVLAEHDLSASVDDLAIGGGHIFIAERTQLVARSQATGEVEWTHRYAGADGSVGGIVIDADPTGAVIASGTFSGKLTSGPGGPEFYTSDRRGFVVAHASDATVQWAITSDTIGIAELDHVARAPDGSVAVHGGTGGSNGNDGQRIALLGADGALRWSHDLGRLYTDRVSSIATDGTRIVVAGDFTTILSFEPSIQNAGNTDGFIVSLGAGGIEWIQVAGGPETQHAYVKALPNASSAIVAVDGIGTELDTPPSLVVGDVVIENSGLAILELAR